MARWGIIIRLIVYSALALVCFIVALGWGLFYLYFSGDPSVRVVNLSSDTVQASIGQCGGISIRTELGSMEEYVFRPNRDCGFYMYLSDRATHVSACDDSPNESGSHIPSSKDDRIPVCCEDSVSGCVFTGRVYPERYLRYYYTENGGLKAKRFFVYSLIDWLTL